MSRAQRVEQLRQIDFRQTLAQEGAYGEGALGAATAIFGVYGSVFGNVGFGDGLMMGLAKTATSRVLASTARNTLNGTTLQMLEDFILRDVAMESHGTVRRALRSPTRENTTQAHEALAGNFQTGHALNGAVTACSVVQLAYTYYAATSGEGAARNIDGRERGELLEAGVSTLTSIVTFLSRGPIPVNRVTAFFQQLDDILARVDKPVVGAFAIINCAKGLIDLTVAALDNDRREMAVAGFSAASGAFIAVGVLFSVPGAQPIGVVLGIVASAISIAGWVYDATRPPYAGEYLKLIRLVDSSRDLARSFIDEAPLRQVKSAYDRVKEQIQSGSHMSRDKLYFPGAPMIRGPYVEACRELRTVGYEDYSPRRGSRQTVYIERLVLDPLWNESATQSR
jgi:hypothetical protein